MNSEIEFDMEINFRKRSFQKLFIDEVFNLRQLTQFRHVDLSNYAWTNDTGFSRDVDKVLEGIIFGQIQLKKNYSKKEAVRKLLQDWYIFNYNISQNGDNISQMSPGKKSFVLLKLLIDLDNSRCPILLDQPEDDLDNRSIYKELVSFIKDKKRYRQIIIATHNPNLVVGSDAEEIIVANQNGEKSKNRNYQFEYISGSLECSYSLPDENMILYKQGIQEHVCDILEGGRTAFRKRSKKYNIPY